MDIFIVTVLRDFWVDECVVLAADEDRARTLAAYDAGLNSVSEDRVVGVKKVERHRGVIFSKTIPYPETQYQPPMLAYG